MDAQLHYWHDQTFAACGCFSSSLLRSPAEQEMIDHANASGSVTRGPSFLPRPSLSTMKRGSCLMIFSGEGGGEVGGTDGGGGGGGEGGDMYRGPQSARVGCAW